jgi:hypothetical protein
MGSVAKAKWASRWIDRQSSLLDVFGLSVTALVAQLPKASSI